MALLNFGHPSAFRGAGEDGKIINSRYLDDLLGG